MQEVLAKKKYLLGTPKFIELSLRRSLLINCFSTDIAAIVVGFGRGDILVIPSVDLEFHSWSKITVNKTGWGFGSGSRDQKKNVIDNGRDQFVIQLDRVECQQQ